MRLLKAVLNSSFPWLTETSNDLPRISRLMERVERLADESGCPELKVGYIAVDPRLKEVASATNKCERQNLLWNEPPNSTHAERELKLEIDRLRMNQRIADTELCAVGRFSPCRYCVKDLESVRVRAIIFRNLYWDTYALELAEQLGTKIVYFSDLGLSILPHSVIMGLSDLNIEPTRTHPHENKLWAQDSTTSRRESSYIWSHKENLISTLNLLLTDFLRNHQNLADPAFSIRVSKMRAQIETEQECIRWAKMNIILTKHP